MLTYVNMSTLQEKYQFLFESDLAPEENKFVGTGTTSVYLADNNNFSYSSGIISWNSIQLQASATSNRLLEIKDGYFVIPFGCTINLDDNGSFTSGANFPDNTHNGTFDPNIYKYAVSCKAWHHAILDQVRLTYGKVVLSGNAWHNVFVNERMKRMNREQNRMFGDFANVHFDSHDKMNISPTGCLEVNNNYEDNLGQYNRCNIYNTNLVTGSGPLQMYDSAAINDCFEGGLIAVYGKDGKKLSTGTGNTITASQPITTLVFQYVGYLPTSYVSSIFEKMPSVAGIPTMELRITTNLSNNNKWSVTYGAANAAGVYEITGTSGVQSVGNVCPFMVGQFSENGDNGTVRIIKKNDANPMTVSVVPYIGYYAPNELGDNAVSSGKIAQRSSSYPCRLVIPSIAYNADLREIVYKQPPVQIPYDDFTVDVSITNRIGGSTVQHQLQSTVGRMRKLYVIPYFVSKDHSDTFLPVYQSLVSSAPTTCSPCKLNNFMVSLSGANIFAAPMVQSHDFYINNNLISQAQINGNAFNSSMVSGEIPFSQWTSGAYQVYEVLLDRAVDQVADNESPTIQVSFKIMSKSDYAYNFLFLTAFQNVVFIDRVDGSVVSSTTN